MATLTRAYPRPVRVTATPITAQPGDAPSVDVVPAPAPDGVVVGAVGAPDRDGRREIEVVVAGWRFLLRAEDAALADLRDRATRARPDEASADGPVEIRAIIPGRVVEVLVAPGDVVASGAPLAIVEAMKMQNELRAPRPGTVARIGAAAGSTVELGDIVVVLA